MRERARAERTVVGLVWSQQVPLPRLPESMLIKLRRNMPIFVLKINASCISDLLLPREKSDVYYLVNSDRK